MFKDVLKYFMWGYQQHFQYSAEYKAKSLFDILSPKLKPNVFLLGFIKKETEGMHPVCVEPEEAGVDLNKFSNIRDLAKTEYEQDENSKVMHTHPIAHKNFHNNLKTVCLLRTIKMLLDEQFAPMGKINFISRPADVEGYDVITVLQFDKSIYESFHHLKRHEIPLSRLRKIRLNTSMIEATAYEFLSECSRSLLYPEPMDVFLEIGDSLRRAGGDFMKSLSVVGKIDRIAAEGLFSTFNRIASKKYEGKEAVGKILLCREDHPCLKYVLKFVKPIPLTDVSIIRKILETSSKKYYLITDSLYIYGLVTPSKTYDPDNEDLFIIEFEGNYNWHLTHDHKTLLNVENGFPRITKEKIDTEKFKDDVKRLFPKLNGEKVDKIWKIVSTITKEKHGTLLILTEKANSEAERLSNQAIKIEPREVDDELIKQITKIDGAVLIDENCVCHAIGVILDGISTTKGSPSRGARYNSAIRYVESEKGTNSMAIIISSDGVVDFYPNLKAKIRKSEIAKRIEILEAQSKLQEVEFDNIREAYSWLDKNRFYLTKEMCEEINNLIETIQPKIKMKVSEIIFQVPSFTPHPDMNTSYFLE